MNEAVEVEPGAWVPAKCEELGGPGVEANPCVEAGLLLRCILCPLSPSYWRKATES